MISKKFDISFVPFRWRFLYYNVCPSAWAQLTKLKLQNQEKIFLYEKKWYFG